MLEKAASRLTHNYVLDELVPLCRTRGMSVNRVLDFTIQLLDANDVEIIWIDEPLHREAMDLLRARPDKTYSLCDAVSFVVMRRHGLTEALTTNRHFEQEGFVRLLRN